MKTEEPENPESNQGSTWEQHLNLTLKPGLMKSLEPVKDGLKDLFGQLTQQEEAFRACQPATEEDMDTLVESLHFSSLRSKCLMLHQQST